MDMFSTLLVSLRFDNRSLGGNKRSNCQLTNLQVFQLIVLMPFFAIKGFSHYKNSILSYFLCFQSCCCLLKLSMVM